MCPLRPATDLCLGEPLPHQLANRPRSPLSAHCCFPLSGLCGISFGFPKLFPTKRCMIHVLLTRTPLYSGCPFLVRLACVKRAASVDSEPGSNSRLNPFVLEYSPCSLPLTLLESSFRSCDWSSQISLKTSDEIKFASNQIFKDQHSAPAMFPKHGLAAGLEGVRHDSRPRLGTI